MPNAMRIRPGNREGVLHVEVGHGIPLSTGERCPVNRCWVPMGVMIGIAYRDGKTARHHRANPAARVSEQRIRLPGEFELSADALMALSPG